MLINTAGRLKMWREGHGLDMRGAARFFRVGFTEYQSWETGAAALPGPAQVAAELAAQVVLDRHALGEACKWADAALASMEAQQLQFFGEGA